LIRSTTSLRGPKGTTGFTVPTSIFTGAQIANQLFGPLTGKQEFNIRLSQTGTSEVIKAFNRGEITSEELAENIGRTINR